MFTCSCTKNYLTLFPSQLLDLRCSLCTCKVFVKHLYSCTVCIFGIHWLPIKFCISNKTVLLAYKALNGLAPAYLTNFLSLYNSTHSIKSQNSGLLEVPRIAKSIKGGSYFSYLAPKLWNSLPDNVWGSDTLSLSLSLFKSRLKTHFFSQA